MKKVLIISYAFPPLNEIASRRYSEMIPFFHYHGWKPYVLTTKSSGDLKVKLSENQIFRIGEHPGLNLHVKKKVTFKSFIAETRRKLGFMFRVFDSDLFKWSSVVLNSSDLIERISKEKIDIIIASYGPSSVLRIGASLGESLNVPVTYDFRDLASLHEDKSFKQNWLAKVVDRAFEKHYLRSAAGFITVSKGLAERIESQYKQRIHVVYNGYTLNELEGDTCHSLPTNKPYLYYAGRFYDHRLDSVYLLIDALESFEYKLIIRSLGPIELDEKIKRYALHKNVAHKVEILDKTKAEIVEYESRNAAVNLVFEDLEKVYKSLRGVLTGKFLQLLTYDAPVLAIARSDSEIGEILNETGKGRLASSEREVVDFLNTLDKEENVVDSSKIFFYSKEEQAKSLIHYLEEKIRQ